MRVPSLLSLVGFIMLIVGTYCPMLRPFGLFSWNVYEMNKPFGMVMILVAVIGMIGVVFNRPKVVKPAAWGSLILVILLYIAAYLKVHTSFSFMPFQSVEQFLVGKIKFKWGWYVLFAGAMLSLAMVLRPKKQNIL